MTAVIAHPQLHEVVKRVLQPVGIITACRQDDGAMVQIKTHQNLAALRGTLGTSRQVQLPESIAEASHVWPVRHYGSIDRELMLCWLAVCQIHCSGHHSSPDLPI